DDRRSYVIRTLTSAMSSHTMCVSILRQSEVPALVCPCEELDEVLLLSEVGGDRRKLAGEHLAGRPVDVDRVSFLYDLAADAHLALLKVDVERGDARDAR